MTKFLVIWTRQLDDQSYHSHKNVQLREWVCLFASGFFIPAKCGESDSATAQIGITDYAGRVGKIRVREREAERDRWDCKVAENKRSTCWRNLLAIVHIRYSGAHRNNTSSNRFFLAFDKIVGSRVVPFATPCTHLWVVLLQLRFLLLTPLVMSLIFKISLPVFPILTFYLLHIWSQWSNYWIIELNRGIKDLDIRFSIYSQVRLQR